MLKEYIYRRITHKYRDAYRHLDREEYVTTLSLTPPKLVQAPDYREMSDGGVYVQHARIPANLTKKQRQRLIDAVGDTLSYHGCHHEHDCCGCASVNAWPVKIDGRKLTVHLRIGYNY